MAFYNYKLVRNQLMNAGWIDEYGEPINPDKFGEGLDPGYNGNLYKMTADYIQSLEERIKGLEGSLSNA